VVWTLAHDEAMATITRLMSLERQLAKFVDVKKTAVENARMALLDAEEAFGAVQQSHATIFPPLLCQSRFYEHEIESCNEQLRQLRPLYRGKVIAPRSRTFSSESIHPV
jgi:hypothetical protein